MKLLDRGVLYTLSAYLTWGILPIYWKLLEDVPAMEVSSHRVLWSLVVFALLLTYLRDWDRIVSAIRQPKILLIYSVTACLLLLNWTIYIWAVSQEQIVATSLGYFINPLVSVLLGVLFLRERLRFLQWTAIAIAAIGVIYLTVTYGRLPWISLSLAMTFGCYALLKKTAPLNSLEGMTVEILLLLGPMLFYFIWLTNSGAGVTFSSSLATIYLLSLTGLATGVPYLLFTAGARRVPLSTVGLLQYVAPTMQFLLGTLIYHEPFSYSQLLGFSLIWTALILYTGEGFAVRRSLRMATQEVY